MKEYALYKGEELLHIGTAPELAKMHGVKTNTIYHYANRAYKKRVERIRKTHNFLIAVPLGDSDE